MENEIGAYCGDYILSEYDHQEVELYLETRKDNRRRLVVSKGFGDGYGIEECLYRM